MRRSVCVGALIAAAGVVAGCETLRGDEVVYETGRPAEVTPDGLHRVKSDFARVYLKPGTDMRPFDKIVLSPIELRYRLVKAKHYTGVRALETEELRQRFRAIFEKELAKSTVYTLTDQPGPGVLEVGAELIDLAILKSGSDETKMRILMPSTMTLMLEVRDSVSNEVLARASRKIEVKGGASVQWQRGTVHNPKEAAFLYRHWATRLREWLDNVREIPPLPEPPAEPAVAEGKG